MADRNSHRDSCLIQLIVGTAATVVGGVVLFFLVDLLLSPRLEPPEIVVVSSPVADASVRPTEVVDNPPPSEDFPTSTAASQVPSMSTPEPTRPKATSVPTQLPSPQTGVEILIFDDTDAGSRGQILVEITTAGEIGDICYPLRKATEDFIGKWRVVDEWLGCISPGEVNSYVLDFDPGYYAILFDSPEFFSYHGDLGLNTVFVPKQEWRTTLVRASLGLLEVGVLSADGEALQKEQVIVARQDVDVTGNPVEAEGEGGIDDAGIRNTDARGIAQFPLAEGTYVVSIFESSSSFDRYRVFDVQIRAGQQQKMVITRPY